MTTKRMDLSIPADMHARYMRFKHRLSGKVSKLFQAALDEALRELEAEERARAEFRRAQIGVLQ